MTERQPENVLMAKSGSSSTNTCERECEYEENEEYYSYVFKCTWAHPEHPVRLESDGMDDFSSVKIPQ